MAVAQEAPGLPRKDSAYYAWTFPGAPVHIHLYLEAVAGLQRELAKAASPESGGRMEVAGLLLGKGDLRNTLVIEVRGFVPVLCEGRPNSAQTLTDAELRKFEASLAEQRAATSSRLTVVGYYRAHGSEGLSLNEDDLTLIRSHFRDPASVFLMIRPGETGHAMAGFFFWDGGQINADFTFLEFPLDAETLASAPPKPVRRPRLVEPAPKPEPPVSPPAPVTALVPPAPSGYRAASPLALTPARRSHAGRWWLAAGALAVMSVGGLAYWNSLGPVAPAAPAAAPAAPALSLRVERQGNELKVTWDRSSQFIATAKAGLLQVRDGERQQQDLYLEPGQLRTGSVVYTPVSATVQFRLEVFGSGGKSLNESVLALTAPPAETPKR